MQEPVGVAENALTPEVVAAGKNANNGSNNQEKTPTRSIFQKCLEKFIPYGGLMSSSLNLASATLGAGILSLPTGFKMSGIAMAVVYLVLVGIATVYSLNLLGKVAVKTGVRTYGEAAQRIIGVYAGYYVAGLMMIMCFGGSVAYIIIVGILLRTVVDRPSVPDFLRSDSGIRLLTSLVWLLVIVPLSIPKEINSLRHASLVGVLCIVFFSFVVVGLSIDHAVKEGFATDVVIVRGGNQALGGFSLFLFSYVCQPNAFEIFREMTHRTPPRFTLYGIVGVMICGVLYLLVGLFGYLHFGNAISDTVISLYDPLENVVVAIGFIGVAVKVCVAFVLHLIPMRDALYHCLKWKVEQVPYWKHSMVVVTIDLLALICGLFIPKVNTVFGFVGSFCGGHIGLIFPALFYMYCGGFTREKVGNLDYFGSYLLLCVGVVAVVFGTASTIYGAL